MEFTEPLPLNSLFPLFVKEKDPSNILAALEKGLRSKVINEQYESLLFFTRLIHQFPQQVIINTAFTKLSELFHVGYGLYGLL